jgi:hypothetical protein
VTALDTPGAGKAMHDNPAFKIAAELAFDRAVLQSALAAIAGEFEPGGEVRRLVHKTALPVVAR